MVLDAQSVLALIVVLYIFALATQRAKGAEKGFLTFLRKSRTSSLRQLRETAHPAARWDSPLLSTCRTGLVVIAQELLGLRGRMGWLLTVMVWKI